MLCYASENLGAALLRFEQYQRLIFDVNPMEFRFNESTIELVWDVSNFKVRGLVEQVGFAVTTHFARTISRGDIKALKVRFSGESPEDTKPFEDFFGGPVSFNEQWPGFVFDNRILTLPLRSADSSMIGMLEQHANGLLDKLPQREELVEKVRREISRSLIEGEPDIDAISQRLHCSSRTLQRKLLAAQTNFRKEVGLVRLELANPLCDPFAIVIIAKTTTSLGGDSQESIHQNKGSIVHSVLQCIPRAGFKSRPCRCY